MIKQTQLQKKKAFVEKYGSGPSSYFRSEGAAIVIIVAITLLMIGAATFALSEESPINVGYMFLLVAVALAIGSVATFV
ncbi:hypothetical protein BGZ65_003720, partial [Modicella reniformis]